MKKLKRTRARHFGDNPNIRRKYGEANRINPAEPWERRYAKKYRRLIKVPSHTRKIGRKKVKVKGYHRLYKKYRKK